MVSTRSHSVLSAGAAADTAATAGEVNSAAPTPRRSGRLARSSGSGAAAATPTAPRSVRATKTRKQLEAVSEVEEQQEAHQAQQQAPQQEAQQHAEQQGEQLSPRARRRSTAAANAAQARSLAGGSQQDNGEAESEGAAGEGAGEEPVLRADAALVDVLAEQMFAALEEFTNQQRQGETSSESDPEEEEAEQQPSGGAPDQQQRQQQGVQQSGDDSSSESDSGGSEDEGEAGGSVPSHLRWQPELTLPGHAARGSDGGAAAGGAAAAAGVHVVRRGKDGLHVPPPDERLRAKAARQERPDTAGKGWFDLPATQVTDEVKNDLRMLRLRGAMDPKAHYKKLDTTKFPKYFQMGTVVESAADFYSARLTKKQRKRTLTEEVMADAQLTEVRKKRFTKLQEERSYWSKKPAKKTSNERRKKAHRRPKH
ncbi:hypothetical protein ABPG77_003008 [Micractinium sp. CCAP 211/92]